MNDGASLCLNNSGILEADQISQRQNYCSTIAGHQFKKKTFLKSYSVPGIRTFQSCIISWGGRKKLEYGSYTENFENRSRLS